MLDTIYVVEPNFLLKNIVGVFDFGRLHKLFSKRIVYVDNLYELGKVEDIAKSKVLEELPTVLKQQKAIKDEKKALKNGALQNIENKGQHKKEEEGSGTVPVLKAVQKIDFLTIPLENHVLLPLIL